MVDYLDVPVGGLHTFPRRYVCGARLPKKFDFDVVPQEERENVRAMAKTLREHCTTQGTTLQRRRSLATVVDHSGYSRPAKPINQSSIGSTKTTNVWRRVLNEPTTVGGD